MSGSESTEPVVALVVAAGSAVPEGAGALAVVAGESLLRRSVYQLVAGGCTDVVVIAPSGRGDEFAAEAADATASVIVVAGTGDRQESVRAGLVAVAENQRLREASVVLVHDVARPLVPVDVVARVIEGVRGGAVAVVPCVGVVGPVRQVTEAGSFVLDDSSLRAVQTPQGFDLATLVDAHNLAADCGVHVVDDAAVCEYAGHEVALIEGSPRSLLIRDPADVAYAEALLRAG